jgi:hypothetical protein
VVSRICRATQRQLHAQLFGALCVEQAELLGQLNQLGRLLRVVLTRSF